MSRTGRIVIAVVGSVLAFLLMLVVAGVVWWKNHSTEIYAAGDQAQADALAYAAESDMTGCVDRALLRFDACESFSCQVANHVFLRACLDAAAPVPGFCEGVPRTDDFRETLAWRVHSCVQLERPGTLCQSLLGQVQEYCESR